MLSLDHIPFHGPDPEALATGFSRLGFTVSPPSRYTAPDHPDAAWRGRCVFTRSGWLDLLFEPRAPQPNAPSSLLFRTDDLDQSRRDLAAMNPDEPFRLERRWADLDDLPPERFAYVGLPSRVAPFMLAVIEHARPCAEVQPRWLEHANGAQAIVALILGGEAPGPAAATAARFLDPAAIEYWPRDTFDQAFPGMAARRALRVRVTELTATASVLSAAEARFVETSDGLAVPPQFGVGAGILFSP